MIKDTKGKSLAFFLEKNKNKILTSKQLNKIKNISIKKKKDIRICLHNSKLKGPQIMFISKYRNEDDKKKYFIHKQNKMFLILDGKLVINNKKKKFELIKNRNICFFVMKKNILSTFSKSKISLYLEVIFKK